MAMMPHPERTHLGDSIITSMRDHIKNDYLLKHTGLSHEFPRYDIENFKANKKSSIIGFVGLFNLPIIKYSVDWWSTLHQPSSITLTSEPTIHYTMLIPLIIMFFAMIIYTLIIFLMRYKTEVIKFKLDKRKNYK